MKTEKFINALFAMVEAKMEYNSTIKSEMQAYHFTKLKADAIETAKQEFDKAFMEAVDIHIKETSK